MSAKERSWFLNSKVTMYAFCKYVKTKLTGKILQTLFSRNEMGKINLKVRIFELIITVPHIEFQVEFIYRYT